MTDSAEQQREQKRAPEREAPAGEEPGKRVHLVASKIHGIAPVRHPRVGPEYQAVIPDLCAAAQAAGGAAKTGNSTRTDS